MQILIGSRSDVGLVRMNNEDHYAVDSDLNLLILCDGMGGQAAGEVASRMAVEGLLEHCREAARSPEAAQEGGYNQEFSAFTNRLASGIRQVNQRIYEAASNGADQAGMGCTVVAAKICDNILSIAHVGDSRIYLLRDGQLRQLTEDHSLVWQQVKQGLLTREEAEQSELANVILRALGAETQVEVDMDELWVGPGDQILLCSDGLTRMVTETEIVAVLQSVEDVQEAADKLVELANENGGEDNTTVIVARLLRSQPGWKRWVSTLRGGDQAWRS